MSTPQQNGVSSGSNNNSHSTNSDDVTVTIDPAIATATTAPSTQTTATTTDDAQGDDVSKTELEAPGSKTGNFESHVQRAISQTWVVPDGGYGWVVMLCSLLVSAIVDGVTYTFGVFLNDLEAYFQQPKSTITLANSLQVGLYLISGPVVSALTNRYGCRPVIITGSIVTGFSFLVSATSPNITVLILTYGVMGGIGFGMMYLPSVVAVSVYFDSKRALATGIAVCGSGIGTFALAPLAEILLVEYGWRWTLALLGGVTFNGIICGALIRPLEIRVLDRRTRRRTESMMEDSVANMGHSAGSIHSKKTQNSKFPSNRKIPESIPLITLTDDDTHTILLVDPNPKQKQKKNNNLDTTFLSPTGTGPGNAGQDAKLFSSTPNFSVNQVQRSPGMPKKKSDSLSSGDQGEITIMKHRKRANTMDNINLNKLSQFEVEVKEFIPKERPRAMSHAPIGLAFIGVSDVHINRIRDDVALPLSRRDINKSMAQMEFGEIMVERLHSQDSLHSQVSSLDDVTRKGKGLWAFLPESARETLEEMLNFGIFEDKRYWFVLAGNFVCMIGFYVPFVYIPGRATEMGLSDEKAAFLISLIGITNLVGRVTTGVLVNYLPIDSVMVTTIALALGGLVTILCPLCETYASLAVLACIFGLCVAAYISVCSILLCELLGVRNLTNAFGYVILFRGMACIMGPPITGALIDATGRFDPAFFVGGGMIMLGAVSHFILLTPCIKKLKSS